MENQNMNILIVEDNEADFEVAKFHLKKRFKNATITRSESIGDFKEIIKVNSVDVIICDFQLQDGTGLDALFYIVTNDLKIPFVFFTGALNNEQQAADAIFKGADGYILKDNISLLPETIEKILVFNAEELKKKQERDAKISKAMLLVGLATSKGDLNELGDQLKKVKNILEDLRS